MFLEKMQALAAIPTGCGLQKLFDESYRIIGLPVLMHDMEYKLTAFSEKAVTDDPIWLEYISTGTVCRATLEFFKDAPFIEEAANAERIVILQSAKLRCDRIFGKLFNAENIQIGCTCMVANERFREGEPELFELFCAKLNNEIALINYFTEYGQSYQDFLIAQLIENSITEREMYGAHIESIYIGLASNLFLAKAAFPPAYISGDNELAACQKRLKQMFPQYKYIRYRNELLILMSSDNSDLKAEFLVLNDFLKIMNARLIISKPFDNLYFLPEVYEELQTLNAAK